jgi:hypothetical protein
MFWVMCFWVAQRDKASLLCEAFSPRGALAPRSFAFAYFCVGFAGVGAGAAGCVFTGCVLMPCSTDVGPARREA